MKPCIQCETETKSTAHFWKDPGEGPKPKVYPAGEAVALCTPCIEKIEEGQRDRTRTD